jgi:predicted Rossmann fold flavoprotein
MVAVSSTSPASLEASSLDVLIIGAGASGCFCAAQLLEARPETRLLILESGQTPLAKVRISGGGRCNVTTALEDPKELLGFYPRQHKGLLGAFHRFGPPQMKQWLNSQGVRLKTEADGRVFPLSDSSDTIIQCFLERLQSSDSSFRKQPPIWCQSPVAESRFLEAEQGFEVLTRRGQKLRSRCLVLATGSSSSGYQLAESFGHVLAPRAQSLFTFCLPDGAWHELAGVSVPWVRARLSVAVKDGFIKVPPKPLRLEQEGPLLITHWGLSGPVILKLSAWGAYALQASGYEASLSLDWLPSETAEALETKLCQMKATEPLKRVGTFSPVPPLPKRLWQHWLKQEALPEALCWQELPLKTIRRLVQRIKQQVLSVSGKGAFKEEFVTAGGVSLNELHLPHYESKLQAGLYCLGELCHVDGLTGGYNFQHAWTSAALAAQSIVEKLSSHASDPV